MEKKDEFEVERHSKVFEHKLASLNKSVASWITKHVEKNACVDLSPVFNDYKKHFAAIDEEYKKAVKNITESNKSDVTETSENAEVKKQDVVPFKFNSTTSDISDRPSIVTLNGSEGKETEKSLTVPCGTDDKKPSIFGDLFKTQTNSSLVFAPISSSTASSVQAVTTTTSSFSGFKFTASSVSAPVSSVTPTPNFGSLFKAAQSSNTAMSGGLSLFNGFPPISSSSATPFSTFSAFKKEEAQNDTAQVASEGSQETVNSQGDTGMSSFTI